MQVREISNPQANALEYSTLKPKEITVKTEQPIENPSADSASDTAWQKDILMQALDKLENNMHVDNSLPLNKQSSGPIESFDEALIELSFTKTPFFRREAASAQANIKAEDILSLFTEN